MAKIKFLYRQGSNYFMRIGIDLQNTCCQICRFAAMPKKEKERFCRYCIVSREIRRALTQTIDSARLTEPEESEGKPDGYVG